MIKFNNESDHSIPFEITSQIAGHMVTYPVLVQWDGEPHIVVNLCENGGEMKVGEVATGVTFIEISLSPAKYFDLER